MGIFNKVKTAASAVGSATTTAAANASGSALTNAKENAKLLAIKGEITSINSQLTTAYEQIGEKYVDIAIASGDVPDIGVMDILGMIEPKLDKKMELNKELIQIEKGLKDELIMTEKAAAKKEFEGEKQKLDKALSMGVVSQEDYDQKIGQYQKKVDKFVELRNLQEQLSMGIIDQGEHDTKKAKLLV